MSLFQRLFRKATAQPVLPSDVLVSLLYSKLLALPAERFYYDENYAQFTVELGPDRWVNFSVYLGKQWTGYVSSPLVLTSTHFITRESRYSRDEIAREVELPVTPSVKLMAEALGHMRAAARKLKIADAEANVQLNSLDLVNDILGLPTPEDQLALGQDYPRAEAVTVARPPAPQAKEFRK